MATCRVLYHEGAKIALKKPAVISTVEQLASFLIFLRADNSSRCRYLRRLELVEFFPEDNVVQDLIETLPLLTSIENLQLTEAELILDVHHALTPAFCTLTTLRHIDFTGVKAKTCTLLLGLHAPLVSANLNFLSNDDEKLWDDLEDDAWVRYHPTTLLDNFASTLEMLGCVSWYINHDMFIMPTKVYPNMRKLSFKLHYFPLRIDAFIRAFPNLTDLQVNTEYHDGNIDLFSWDTMLDSHAMNVAQQHAHVNSCGTWAHLEHFYGCLLDIYAIGITSHIRRITLVDLQDDGRRKGMLATVLRYARPLHLKLEMTSTLLGDADEGFIAMLRDEGASNLINLNVHIYFIEGDQDKDLSIVIDSLISALTSLPLKFLELGFETSSLDPTPRKATIIDRIRAQRQGLPEPPVPTPTPLTPAELSLQSLEMDTLIDRLESMPSLQAARVVVLSSRDGGHHGWEGHERTIKKGTSQLAGREQWRINFA
ncbi:hypothetical protein GSI_07325 [Ganoderma sinense ZZ0214-1]|uniref:F-box domain-containing protein n=1 Tax=Ganoderma sinense ZZ0214-1 TaxID=1077348 RepID=A0A2G8SA42_9APHY|nr:hypothetical protein GSI_07325 [Ganoderma sinense ZZ0214-1]